MFRTKAPGRPRTALTSVLNHRRFRGQNTRPAGALRARLPSSVMSALPVHVCRERNQLSGGDWQPLKNAITIR